MSQGVVQAQVLTAHRHPTMREVVVEKLHQAILEGHLAPGQKLVYAELAKDLNVSVTPIREALKTLETLGLVTIRPYRTAYVSCLTAEELQQVYTLRKQVEGFASRRAAQLASQEELSHLRGILADAERETTALTNGPDEAARSKSIVRLQQLHDEFHMSLYAASGNKYLCHLINILRGYLGTYFPVISRHMISRVNEAHREHNKILVACEERNPELAERLIQEHLEHTLGVLLDYIKSNHLPDTATRTEGVGSQARVAGVPGS